MNKPHSAAQSWQAVVLEQVDAYAKVPRGSRPLTVSLNDLGYDSLDAVALQMDIEVWLGHPIGIDQVSQRDGLNLTVQTLLDQVEMARTARSAKGR